jgi:hypothetical protein
LNADDWDPNDDTFDPNIKSVVIGNASWIGDPSPFVHTDTSRTGYTYVNATNFEGFPPSVQISLMVPLAPGETKPSVGGMLMFNKDQAVKIVQILTDVLKADKKEKQNRIQIETSLKDADWVLVATTDNGQRFLQFENKLKDRVDKYRFSINASRKLLGAVQHSVKGLATKTDK